MTNPAADRLRDAIWKAPNDLGLYVKDLDAALATAEQNAYDKVRSAFPEPPRADLAAAILAEDDEWWAETPPYVRDSLERLARSAEPPFDVERLARAIKNAHHGKFVVVNEWDRESAERIAAEYARLAGAVPALQATGEPTDDA